MDEPIHPDLDARSADAILEGINPIPVDLGHLHLHHRNVSCGIHSVKQFSIGFRYSAPTIPCNFCTVAQFRAVPRSFNTLPTAFATRLSMTPSAHHSHAA